MNISVHDSVKDIKKACLVVVWEYFLKKEIHKNEPESYLVTTDTIVLLTFGKQW